jgi:hypothetical protein
MYISYQVCGSIARRRDYQISAPEEGICTSKQKENISIHYPRHYINVVLAKENDPYSPLYNCQFSHTSS